MTRHFVSYFGNLLTIKLRAKRLPASAVDEIRQETFARVLAAVRREGIRDGRKLGAFLNTTCNHVISEYFRQTGRYAPLEDSHFERATGGVDAETRMVSLEREQRVHEALRTLAERDRYLLTALFSRKRTKMPFVRSSGSIAAICASCSTGPRRRSGDGTSNKFLMKRNRVSRH